MADLNPNILEMTLPIFRLNTPIKRDWGGGKDIGRLDKTPTNNPTEC